MRKMEKKIKISVRVRTKGWFTEHVHNLILC